MLRPFIGSYQRTLPRTWWMRNRRYAFFGLRELSAISVAAWVVAQLVEVWLVGWSGSGFIPFHSPLYVAFSVVCFVGALLHSITWLNLSGVILRIPMGERAVPPRVVTLANYAQWAGVTVVVGALLVWMGTWR